MMIRRELLENHDNPERWMISYADFITLLFAFFVVMYAISSVNEDKYKVLSETLAQAFDVPASSLQPIAVGEPTLAASPHVVDIPEVDGRADVDYGDTQVRDDQADAQSIAGLNALQGVSTTVDNDWLEINLAADTLFPQGGARLSDAARQTLAETAERLLMHSQPVTIEGYTDNVPVTGGPYRSNWELAAARASAVAELFVAAGVRPERLAAIGYGENHPLQTNATPDGRAANRRVAVIVARRGDLARNRNASTPRTAVVNHTRPDRPDELEAQRTATGGLLFSAPENSGEE